MPSLEAVREYDPYQPRRLLPTMDELMAKERVLAVKWKARLDAKIKSRDDKTDQGLPK